MDTRLVTLPERTVTQAERTELRIVYQKWTQEWAIHPQSQLDDANGTFPPPNEAYASPGLLPFRTEQALCVTSKLYGTRLCFLTEQ